MGDDSATGVAFRPQPGATGENKFYGEMADQCSRVSDVRGRHSYAQPDQRVDQEQAEQASRLPGDVQMFGVVQGVVRHPHEDFEHHYHDMQDIEFTIEAQKLYMLQCRNGKRTKARRP